MFRSWQGAVSVLLDHCQRESPEGEIKVTHHGDSGVEFRSSDPTDRLREFHFRVVRLPVDD